MAGIAINQSSGGKMKHMMPQTVFDITRAAILTLCALCCAARAESPPNGDLEKSFNKIKRTAVQQLKSRKPAERLAAVQQLADFPTTGAAETLLEVGCNSNDPDIRAAAYKTLAEFSQKTNLCDLLFHAAKMDLRKAKDSVRPATCAALRLLLLSDRPEAEKQSDELIELAATRPGAGQQLLVSVVDDLTAQGGDKATAAVIKVSKSDAFKNMFGVRRAAIQSLTQSGSHEAVGTLVGILGHVRGETRADVVRYLIGVSGKSQGMESEVWQSWWNSRSSSYQPPREKYVPTMSTEIPQGTSSYYYGLPVYAERIVFVIDTSDSMAMSDNRLDVAKRELTSAILGLPDSASFTVLTFNAAVYAWSPVLVPSNAATRLQAAEFVTLQKTAFQTVTYDALEAALKFDAEAIFFLTDGEPYGGKITDPGKIVSTITGLNHPRRMSINCISVGPLPGANAFLKNLSEKNWGTYRRAGN
jgi:hypothetical protein